MRLTPLSCYVYVYVKRRFQLSPFSLSLIFKPTLNSAAPPQQELAERDGARVVAVGPEQIHEQVS